MRQPEGVVCMHTAPDFQGCAQRAALKAKITELPRAEASPRVAATKMLLCCCYIMYASCPITALDAFFFQKNVRRHTPTPPPPPSVPYCTADRRTHPPTPLFLKRDPPHDRGSQTRLKFSL